MLQCDSAVDILIDYMKEADAEAGLLPASHNDVFWENSQYGR